MNAPTRRARFLRLACLTLLLASPALGTFQLLAFIGRPLRDYVPGFPNDEIVSFLEVRAFATHGFRSGYFGVDEQVAPASFSRFGTHGPGFAVVYGLPARLLGPSSNRAAYLNVAALTLALGAYCGLTRPGNSSVLLLAAFFLTFWPYYQAVLSWMQEGFHFAVAVLLAGLFSALLDRPTRGRRYLLFAVTFLVVCGASLVRVNWVLLLPPLFVLGSWRQSVRAALLAAFASCFAVVACMKGFQLLCAPFSATRDAFLMNKLFTGSVDLQLFWKHVWKNLVAPEVYLAEGSVLARSILLQSALVLAVAAAVAARALARRRRGLPPPVPGAGWWVAFIGYNQAAIVFATMTLYVVANNGAARIFSVHLLLGLLTAVQAPQRWLKALLPACLGINLLTLVPVADFVRNQYLERFEQCAAVEDFRDRAGSVLAYEPGPDGWANTLLTDRLPIELSGLPAGIGVEIHLSQHILSQTIRSRYIIGVPVDLRRSGRRVRLLTELPGLLGTLDPVPTQGVPGLYLNLDPEPSSAASTAPK